MVTHGPPAAGREPGPRDPDGQGQARAGGQDIPGGLRLRLRPLRPDDAREHIPGLGGVEHIKIDEPASGQIRHPAAGGDQHRARGTAGKQRPDVRGILRVVEDDEHPAVGHPAPVLGGALLLAHRDAVRVHPEIAQEAGQHVAGRDRLARRPDAGWRTAGRPGTAAAVGARRAPPEWSCPGPRPRSPPPPRRPPGLSGRPGPASRSCSFCTWSVRPVKSGISAGSCATWGTAIEANEPGPGARPGDRPGIASGGGSPGPA